MRSVKDVTYIAFIVAIFYIVAALAVQPAEGQTVRYRGRYYRGPVCNSRWCAMCNTIRSLQANARAVQQTTQAKKLEQKKYTPPVLDKNQSKSLTIGRGLEIETTTTTTTFQEAEQAKLPNEAVTDALANLRLTSKDVFCDIGCGEGNILITAVKRYRCRSIGIEIDPQLANKAKENVRKAESEGRIEKGYITVLTGDARDFDPKRYGVTAATAYLFPETLKSLSSTLRRIPRLSVPFHEIEGMNYVTKYMDNYLYVNY